MKLEDALKIKFGGFRREGSQLIVECPKCHHEKLSISPLNGGHHCWWCEDPDVKGWLWDKYGRPNRCDRLLRELSVKRAPAPPPEVKKDAEPVMPCPDGNDCITLDQLGELPSDEAERVEEYLHGRLGDEYELIMPELVGHWDLQYCVRGKEFGKGVFDTTGTLIAPFYEFQDEHDSFTGWQARLLVDPSKVDPNDRATVSRHHLQVIDGKIKTPKYMTMPGYVKARHVQNMTHVYRACGRRWGRARKFACVVCEGFWDAVAVGPDCGVYLMGKTASDEQVMTLVGNCDSGLVVLLLDPDAASEQLQLRERILKHTINCETVVLPVVLHGGKDAGELGRRETWRQILEAANAAGVDVVGKGMILPDGVAA